MKIPTGLKTSFHLEAMSREQLIELLSLRAEGIVKFTQTVTELRQMAVAGTLQSGHLEMLFEWVQEIMVEVMVAEVAITETALMTAGKPRSVN